MKVQIKKPDFESVDLIIRLDSLEITKELCYLLERELDNGSPLVNIHTVLVGLINKYDLHLK